MTLGAADSKQNAGSYHRSPLTPNQMVDLNDSGYGEKPDRVWESGVGALEKRDRVRSISASAGMLGRKLMGVAIFRTYRVVPSFATPLAVW